MIAGAWLQVIPVAGAALAYGLADGLGGSGFIAAFVAGTTFGGISAERPEQTSTGSSEAGRTTVSERITFVIFGAVLLGPALGRR